MKIRLLLFSVLLISTADFGDAGSPTWSLNPVSNNWNKAPNWTPPIVPATQATFDVSNMTDIIAPGDFIGSIVFNPGASAFTISSTKLYITGLGVINNSPIEQNFVSVSCGSCGSIAFSGNSIVSGAVTFTTEGNKSGDLAYGSGVSFDDTSSAGDGTYHNPGGSTGRAWGGVTLFLGSSTAGNGTFIIDGGAISGTGPAAVMFTGTSTAGNATIIANGSTVTGAEGGIISFTDTASLGNATLICYGWR
jgi:hypothetical protein